jgi:hypothetical protein
LPLCEPQQRQTGLRFASCLTRQPIGALGFFEVALQAMQLGELIVGRPGFDRACLSVEVLTRAPCLLDGIEPRTAQLHDLRSANKAGSAKRHHVRMLRAPTMQGRSPLLRPAEIEQVVTGADHAAVDDSGNHRADFAAGDGDHHLVEQGESFGLAVQADARAPLSVPRIRDQIAIAEAGADCSRFFEHGSSRIELAGKHLLQAGGANQPTLMNTRHIGFVDQPLGPSEPSHGLCARVRIGDHAEREPHGAGGGAETVASLQAARVGARPGSDALGILANQLGSGRQPLQILRVEWSLRVGSRQEVVRGGPCPLVDGSSPVGERAHGSSNTIPGCITCDSYGVRSARAT